MTLCGICREIEAGIEHLHCPTCSRLVKSIEDHVHNAAGELVSLAKTVHQAAPVVEAALADAGIVATALGQPTVGALLQSLSDQLKTHEQRLAQLELHLRSTDPGWTPGPGDWIPPPPP